MSIRTERLGHVVQNIAIIHILEFWKIHDHEFWLISILEVAVTSDYWYADIFVTSQQNEKDLPRFLAPVADMIRRSIGKEISIRKTPIIRFRLQKHKKSFDNTLSILHELEQKYDLSE